MFILMCCQSMNAKYKLKIAKYILIPFPYPLKLTYPLPRMILILNLTLQFLTEFNFRVYNMHSVLPTCSDS